MFQVRACAFTFSHFSISLIFYIHVQRLKEAIDSRIAEEQSRQRTSQSTAARTESSARQANARGTSPSRRQGRTAAKGFKQDDKINTTATKGPDPSEFEKDLIDDGEDVAANKPGGSSVDKDKTEEAKPSPGAETEESSARDNGQSKGSSQVVESQKAVSLPTDVRMRLRKLDKLEERYNGKVVSPLRLDVDDS